MRCDATALGLATPIQSPTPWRFLICARRCHFHLKLSPTVLFNKTHLLDSLCELSIPETPFSFVYNDRDTVVPVDESHWLLGLSVCHVSMQDFPLADVAVSCRWRCGWFSWCAVASTTVELLQLQDGEACAATCSMKPPGSVWSHGAVSIPRGHECQHQFWTATIGLLVSFTV